MVQGWYVGVQHLIETLSKNMRNGDNRSWNDSKPGWFGNSGAWSHCYPLLLNFPSEIKGMFELKKKKSYLCLALS